MATFTKIPLSGSTDGRGIHIDDDATPGKLIHTGSTTTTTIDEIWLYAMNYDTTNRKLTIEWGGANAGGDIMELTITAESGLVLVVPGLILKGAVSALEIRAFASAASAINIFGYINRITA
jgi:hypothetical protein